MQGCNYQVLGLLGVGSESVANGRSRGSVQVWVCMVWVLPGLCGSLALALHLESASLQVMYKRRIPESHANA